MLIIRQPIIEQLVEFYYKYDKFQSVYLSHDAVYKIYETLLNKDRLCLCISSGRLMGYGEDMRLGFAEFGKIMCGINLYDHLDDWEISKGDIAYVANVTVDPLYLGSYVMKELTRQFFIKNKGAKYFAGRAFRKKHQPVKVFDFHESYLKWAREEPYNGRV